MKANLSDLNAFVAVVKAQGFRGGARQSGVSASAVSDAVRRLETQLGVRLLHRTTRSVAPTEAGQRLLERLSPALREVEAALEVVNDFRQQPAGTLRLNVPVAALKLVLPGIVADFRAAYPDILLEVVAEDSFVDVLAAGCDAGIRYGERLEQDMIAVPIGPRVQHLACAASPDYLARRGTPQHPRDLLDHACLRVRFHSGSMPGWTFERGSDRLEVDPAPALVVQAGSAADLAVDAAVAGMGLVYLFQDWLQPHLDSGALQPVLRDWWPPFSGPFLYYPGHRLVPAPLRAFADFVRAHPSTR
ncbi:MULTISPECIES: LysR family transcriptional regulator [unclassified Acidovorax]|uniref:LysR family transcriptional regulator n=1 Tax=unclassified Acidovorax TaxID=2684926 RepID=UPI002882DE4B|nr:MULTISPECIES: LysR family transcriptional regulator [unclassified Acidovorax]